MASRTLTVNVVGDSRSLERAFKRSSSSAKKFDHDLGRAGRGALSAAVSFRGMGRALTFGSAQFLGGAGLVFALKSIVTESSRIQEEVEKTGVVFGRSAQDVQAWSKTLAQSFGVGEGAALQAAGTFGNMLRPLRFGQKDAADMSKRLVELAADMASFNNVKPEVVLQALSSGLAGQVRPLRQYGVFLSEARISQEALALGISKTGKNLTQHQKTLASYNIILKDSKNAQGDVARNTGSLSVAMSKLTAGVEDLEAGLGTTLLPTITQYVNTAAKWLNNTQNQQRVQKDFKQALAGVKTVVGGLVSVVKKVDHVTGGLKNTLELLIALKVASTMTGWAGSFTNLGGTAVVSGAKVRTLAGLLRSLSLIGVITIGIEVIIHRKEIDDKVSGFLEKHGLGAIAGNGSIKGVNRDNIDQLIKAAQAAHDSFIVDTLTDVKRKLDAQADKASPGAGPGSAAAEAAAKAAHGSARAVVEAAAGVVTARPRPVFTTQGNQFFDNALTRSLDRVQDLTLPGQIAKLREIAGLIVKRIAATKDVTRKLNLEDQLVDVKRLIKGDIQQVADNAKQAADDAKAAAQQIADDAQARAEEIKQKMQEAAQAILDALQFGVTKAQATKSFADDLTAERALQAGIKSQIAAQGATLELQQQLFDVTQQIADTLRQQREARTQALTGKQFRQLGLTSEGDEITPGKQSLQRRLKQLTGSISGTTLDTPKLRSQLARFRKVLSEGLVPKDVRAKIRDMMNDIADELKGNGPSAGSHFRHVNSNIVLRGLGLTPEQIRALRGRIGQIGAGGTVPGTRSAAFGGGASQPVHVTNIHLDGRIVARSTTTHQARAGKRRPDSRRGTYAGRN